MFRDIFKMGRGRNWRFNQSSLYLYFLAGNETYQCTPWGNPTRNIFGWQKPCYLLVGEGYARTYRELMEDTAWDSYGTGRNPKCANCMVHSGYEATAVNDIFRNPIKAMKVAALGPRTEGPWRRNCRCCTRTRSRPDRGWLRKSNLPARAAARATSKLPDGSTLAGSAGVCDLGGHPAVAVATMVIPPLL